MLLSCAVKVKRVFFSSYGGGVRSEQAGEQKAHEIRIPLTRTPAGKTCQRKKGTEIPYTFRTRYLGGNRFATTACPATAISSDK